MNRPARRPAKIIAASLLILAMVWQHIQATRLGYAVENSRRETQRLKGRIGTLEMSLQTSLSPARLAAQAKDRLGMYPASPDALRILDDGDAPSGGFLRLIARSWRSLVSPLHT